jgi:hypothetical protein
VAEDIGGAVEVIGNKLTLPRSLKQNKKRPAHRGAEHGLAGSPTKTEMVSMQKFFFDMKDGVPMRDQIGIEFKTNAEAILHCKELVQHWRDGSLRDDKDLEISVVNSLGREIHREFVHCDLPS